MKKTAWVFGVFCCLAALQIAAPTSMIVRREATLRDGRLFRFRTAPVDPYDAFRGRYVALAMAEDAAPLPDDVRLVRSQKVYATIKEDEDGFAKLTGATLDRPDGNAYVKATVRSSRDGLVRLRLPFDRYYMDETAAPEAERAYRKHSARESRDAYVAVRIKNGFAVIEELYVGGKPIAEFIAEEARAEMKDKR